MILVCGRKVSNRSIPDKGLRLANAPGNIVDESF
jgi:hypothetical protein